VRLPILLEIKFELITSLRVRISSKMGVSPDTFVDEKFIRKG
jgi:hypothetical protein